ACSAITDSYPSMVEWYCNVIAVRRRQFFLFTHAPSLFSLWTPAAGLNCDEFGAMFRRRAIDTLNGYGFSIGDAARTIDASQCTGPGLALLAPASDRERSAQIPMGRRGTLRTSLGTNQAEALATRGGLDGTAPTPLSP